MGTRVGIWTDNPEGLDTDLRMIGEPVFGSALNPAGTIYTRNLVVVDGTTPEGTVTAEAFLLEDGSDKNHSLSVYAAGTAYALTATSALLDFGTTDPTLVLNKAGTYLLFGRVRVDYAAATFAASRAVTLKLRRTNNTAADISNSAAVLDTDIITTKTYTFGVFSLPPVLYTTALLTDSISIFGDVAVVPSAGALNAGAASIVAIRLY